MRQFLISLAPLLLLSPALVHAQDRVAIAMETHPLSVEESSNGKLRLYNHETKTPVIDQADSIIRQKYLPFYIVKDGKRGVYDDSGHPMIPIEYDRIEAISPFFTLVEKDGLKGVYNNHGAKVIDTIYSAVEYKGYNWSDKGLFNVQKEGKWGICNEEGKYIAQPEYDEIIGGGLFIRLAHNGENDYLINSKTLITGVTIDCLNFTRQTANSGDTQDFYIFQKDGKYGLLDGNGTTFIPPLYDNLFCPGNHYKADETSWLIAQRDSKWGLIDLNENVILPFQYQYIESTWLIGYLAVTADDSSRFFHIPTRTFIDDYSFDKFNVMSEYTTIQKQGKTTLIDNKTMKMVFPFKYEDIYHDEDYGYFCVQKNGLYGLVDADDKVIIPLVYDNLLLISCGGKIVIQKEGKYGIINLKNELLYGMTSHPIQAHSDYFQIYDVENNNPRLDCNLKEIKEE